MKKQDLINAQESKVAEFELSEEKMRRLIKNTDKNNEDITNTTNVSKKCSIVVIKNLVNETC